MSVKFTEKDLGWDQIQKEMDYLKSKVVKVGIISGGGQKKFSTHQDPPGRKTKSKINLVRLGTVHEFGVPKKNIPSRPFMRQTFDSNISKIEKFIKRKQSEVFRGKISGLTALNSLGVFYTGKVKETIKNGSFKALSPKTIKKKGSSKPLIDTGRLRNSIDHEIE